MTAARFAMAGRFANVRTPRARAHAYSLYGLSLHSPWPLPYPRSRAHGLAAIELREWTRVDDSTGGLAQETASWSQHVFLPDGSTFVGWAGLCNCLITADGRQMYCRPSDAASREAFLTYLLGPALSFALLKQGIEPLHSTTVVAGGIAIGLLGDCGAGKSSLGAAFVQAGDRLLTDDLMVLSEDGDRFLAHPGPPRIKLFPEVAARLFGGRVQGTAMNAVTPKIIIPLDSGQSCRRSRPFGAIYLLTRASRARPNTIRIRPLHGTRALMALVSNTFNATVTEPARLRRQLLWSARVASAVPIKEISYPRSLSGLPSVRGAILADLGRQEATRTTVSCSRS